jgi:hypothetical protein
MSGTGPNNDVLNWGRVGRILAGLPALITGQPSQQRAFTYGEIVTHSRSAKQHGAADEGTYFVTRTPTVGTGLATTATPTTYANTNAFLCFTNGNPPGGANMWLDYISFGVTAAGTGGTALQAVTALDNIARYSSGATGGSNGTNLAAILQGPMPSNSNVSKSGSGALVYAGPLVVVAPSPNARILSNPWLRRQIPVVNDRYVLNFGHSDMPVAGSSGVAQATALDVSVPHSPVCIGPGGTFLVTLVLPSQSAASSYEVEIGHIEL